MMRGMFAAISGLKTHQVMLDVTANDIANVNTIGYKSSRMTFQDSLTQLQRGASGADGGNGGSNAAAGRPRRAARLDRQPDDQRRAAVDRQPARRRDPGRRASSASAAAPPTGTPTPNPTASSTPAPATSRTNTAGYLITQDGYYVIGPRDGRTAPDTRRLDDQDPARLDRTSSIDQNGGGQLRRPGTGSPRVTAGYLSLATFSNDAGLERDGGNRWAAVGQLGPPTVGTPGATASASRRPARSRCPTWTSPDVHEHDHRAARLPGQLARHLDRRRDAAGPGEPEALSHAHGGAAVELRSRAAAGNERRRPWSC